VRGAEVDADGRGGGWGLKVEEEVDGKRARGDVSGDREEKKETNAAPFPMLNRVLLDVIIIVNPYSETYRIAGGVGRSSGHEAGVGERMGGVTSRRH
jgi:hypothetical protein